MISPNLTFRCRAGLLAIVVITAAIDDSIGAEPEQATINARSYLRLAPENSPPLTVLAPDESELAR